MVADIRYIQRKILCISQSCAEESLCKLRTL